MPVHAVDARRSPHGGAQSAAAGRPPVHMLRQSEFSRLDASGDVYLDYTGSALHSASQAAAHSRRLLHDVLGNPHSENPASLRSTGRMARARERVLAFFDSDPADYRVIFTANASAALRIVGESFPFDPRSRLVLTADNHNSVNGLRRFARRARAEVQYIPLDDELRPLDPEPWLAGARTGAHLFAYPLQSNFSGARHPLEWVAQAEAAGFHVMLDAAAFVPTAALSLTTARPSFVCVSFYKMFGLPTGVGALIARHDALARLRRPWFAGGTVEWVSTQEDAHAWRADVEAFEDGTPHFHAFDAVIDGLDFLDGVGMERVAAHVAHMTSRLLDGLRRLRHVDGTPMIRLHGPASGTARGGTVSFSVLDRTGGTIPFDQVVRHAGMRKVSLRGGCFCNPGCVEAAFSFDAGRARHCRESLGAAFSVQALAACLGAPVGAVRASVGLPTNEEDIARLVSALEELRYRTT